MKLVFYHDPATEPETGLENTGVDEALSLASLLQQRSGVLEVVDTGQMDAPSLFQRYADAVTASVTKRYRIRQVFGSRRRSGSRFGKGVPALLVFRDNQDRPEDVYPHEASGQMVTIHDFFRQITSD